MHRYDPLFTLQKGVHVYLLSIPAVSLPSFAMQEVSICAFKFIQNREIGLVHLTGDEKGCTNRGALPGAPTSASLQKES